MTAYGPLQRDEQRNSERAIDQRRSHVRSLKVLTAASLFAYSQRLLIPN